MTPPAKRFPLGAAIIIAVTFWAACFGLAYAVNWMLSHG